MEGEGCTCSCIHCSKDSYSFSEEWLDKRINELEREVIKKKNDLKFLKKERQRRIMSETMKAYHQHKRKELAELADTLEGDSKEVLKEYLGEE